MPLSEHEQRLLEQMERALYAEDPKFASSLRGADLRSRYRRRIVLAAICFVLGIALLVFGVVSPKVPLSVVGFLLMLGAGTFALSSWRAMPGPQDTAPAASSGGARSRAGRSRGRSGGRSGGRSSGRFMDRLEERWNRRREGDGR